MRIAVLSRARRLPPLFALLLGALVAPPLAAQPAEGPAAKAVAKTKLIPRKLLFGNPDKAATKISPDGKYLSYLAPVDGVLNVWVAPINNLDAAKPVTKDKKRGIRTYFWAFTSKHILYAQDADGDEDWHVYRVDLGSGDIKDLTPLKKVAARIQGVSHKFPGEILVAVNDRDARFHDVYRVNLETGKRELLQKNDGFLGFTIDDNYKVRFGSKFAPDGSNLILQPDGKGDWKEFLKIPMEDTLTTNVASFDKTGQVAYVIDSRGRDTAAFTAMDLATGKQTLIAADPRCDAGGVLLHQTERTVQAISFTYDRERWVFKDPAVEADFKKLSKVADGEMSVASRTLDDRTWVVGFLMDNGPVRYYLYDRSTGQAKFLFTNRKSLEGLPLQKMHSRILKAGDGLTLVCYLTLPPGSDPDGDGKPDRPVPLVLDVHGGPWGRDSWGFSSGHQLLANRGYAVLNVNFRGSTGFGKKFLNSANREWAGKMHDDLIDAVDWAIKEKIADPQKVAIMGGSYGGYATLVGLTFTPEKFACGVDIVGPSNLVTLLNTIPPYWAPAVQLFKDRVGDHTTEEGKKLLQSRSPLTFVDKIRRPLLIGQGANDPRVKQAESDQIVKAMQEKKIPVTYVLFPDEGHGFARPENRLAFNAVMEAFLAQHLGGRYEAVGEAFSGSTVTVPAGAEGVPGLAGALKGRKTEKGK
ncbi:MAG: S9 family peptidase [Gemmataceae bacterium]|nr:S9 family peptidase [Gemmataceae bacterium]